MRKKNRFTFETQSFHPWLLSSAFKDHILGHFPAPHLPFPLPFPLHLGIQVESLPFPVYFPLPFQAPGTRASPAPLTHGEESEHVFVGAPSFFSVFMVQEGRGQPEGGDSYLSISPSASRDPRPGGQLMKFSPRT